MIDLTPLPHDRRNFVHKRIGRAVKGFVTSGFNPLAAAGAFIAPAPARNIVPRSTTARPSLSGARGQELGRQVKFASIANTGDCPPWGQGRGECLAALAQRPGVVGQQRPGFLAGVQAFLPGGKTGLFEAGPGVNMGMGAAVMGRFGAGVHPGNRVIDRALCARGMVLGNDSICYNKQGFRNGDRMWPRGRRPLLTGGDMRAISIASRAATRLTNTAVKLQEIGLIKKPVARRRSKKKN